jgi:hypothetical protein
MIIPYFFTILLSYFIPSITGCQDQKHVNFRLLFDCFIGEDNATEGLGYDILSNYYRIFTGYNEAVIFRVT